MRGTEGRAGRSRARSSSRACTPRGSRGDRTGGPSSRSPPGTRCSSSGTPGGPRSPAAGREGPQPGPPASPRPGDWREGDRGRGQGSREPHLAGVPALTARTEHVGLDDLIAAVRRVLIVAVTLLVPHHGDLHLLQVVGGGQRRCGEAPRQNRARLLPGHARTPRRVLGRPPLPGLTPGPSTSPRGYSPRPLCPGPLSRCPRSSRTQDSLAGVWAPEPEDRPQESPPVSAGLTAPAGKLRLSDRGAPHLVGHPNSASLSSSPVT